MSHVEIEFFGTVKFTGRKIEWTEFTKCFGCGEKFVGRGKTAKIAHADAVHWAKIHKAQHGDGEDF